MGQEIVEEESSTPNTPNSGDRKLYPKSDGFYELDDTGNERNLTTGSVDDSLSTGSFINYDDIRGAL